MKPPDTDLLAMASRSALSFLSTPAWRRAAPEARVQAEIWKAAGPGSKDECHKGFGLDAYTEARLTFTDWVLSRQRPRQPVAALHGAGEDADPRHRALPGARPARQDRVGLRHPGGGQRASRPRQHRHHPTRLPAQTGAGETASAGPEIGQEIGPRKGRRHTIYRTDRNL